MNLNSGEIHRLNIKSLSKWPYLWLLGWGASACTFDHMFYFFNCQACVRAFICFALVSVLTYSVVIVHGAGDIRLLFKLLLEFWNVLKHTESSSPQRWRFSFALKRNETKRYKLSTKSSTQRASNIRGRTGYNV